MKTTNGICTKLDKTKDMNLSYKYDNKIGGEIAIYSVGGQAMIYLPTPLQNPAEVVLMSRRVREFNTNIIYPK